MAKELLRDLQTRSLISESRTDVPADPHPDPPQTKDYSMDICNLSANHTNIMQH